MKCDLETGLISSRNEMLINERIDRMGILYNKISKCGNLREADIVYLQEYGY